MTNGSIGILWPPGIKRKQELHLSHSTWTGSHQAKCKTGCHVSELPTVSAPFGISKLTNVCHPLRRLEQDLGQRKRPTTASHHFSRASGILLPVSTQGSVYRSEVNSCSSLTTENHEHCQRPTWLQLHTGYPSEGAGTPHVDRPREVCCQAASLPV